MADQRTEKRRPRIYREPAISTSSRYEKWAPVQAILDALELGSFYGATRLIRQMWRNPRLRVAFSTRFAGLTAAEERWLPARQNRDGRAAAEAIREDWPLIISTATREQSQRWGLILGVNFAQPHWYASPWSGRDIPRVEVYDPGDCRWDDARWRYIIQTRDAGQLEVMAPSVSSPDELDAEWIIHEPFGKHSWREGYVMSAAYPWLGNNLSSRDRLRTSEKVGDGTLLAAIPHGANRQAAIEFRDGLRDRGGNAVIPLEEMEDGRKFDVRPLEQNAQNGYQVVADAVAATSADLVILALGQDWSTTNKGGGSYAAVQGGLEVSAGYINRDAKAESDTLYHQVQRRWAEANFGDPDLAPIREVVTNPPERDKAAAQMLVSVSQALDSLARHGADVRACMERFRIPLAAIGAVQVQMPAAPSAPEQPIDTAEQADGADEQPIDAPAQEPEAA